MCVWRERETEKRERELLMIVDTHYYCGCDQPVGEYSIGLYSKSNKNTRLG